MKPVEVSVKDLHDTYCAISKMPVGLRFNRESAWVDFIRAGFTKTDLEAVLNRLVRMVEQGERRPECLKFSNTIEQPDRFEEELAMIKAEANGLKVGVRAMSLMDVERVIEAKQEIVNKLEDQFGHRDAFGLLWDNDEAQAKHRKLRQEIMLLKHRIAEMA